VTHTFRVTITRKSGLSDPEGSVTAKALEDLGFTEVGRVSFGRIITIDVDGPDVGAARERLETMCTRLLANPVMEDYEIEAVS
jgi:phosphoribosylformylglycinamidine synthase subunit PurS